jgi:hypothetical protein
MGNPSGLSGVNVGDRPPVAADNRRTRFLSRRQLLTIAGIGLTAGAVGQIGGRLVGSPPNTGMSASKPTQWFTPVAAPTTEQGWPVRLYPTTLPPVATENTFFVVSQ